MPETLRERLGLSNPKEYRLKPIGYEGVHPTLLYGVELEIENLERDEEDRAKRAIAGMQYHKDGSLRNNGGEFVTFPMNYSALSQTLQKFFKANEYDDSNYSERCSVHVHANCQDLTVEQIRLIVCLYQILEKVLFNYIKAERDNNIFCVPLGESIIASRLLMSDDELMGQFSRKWRKYTALNLLPLSTQGTMEFRHMAGTHDVDFILQWCEIIGCLFKYAAEHKFQDVVKTLMDLNTSSAYATFMQDIFPGNLYEVLAVGPYREFLEEGVIHMKVMLAKPGKAESKSWITEHMEAAAPVAGGVFDFLNQAAQLQRRPVGWRMTNRDAERLRNEIRRRADSGEGTRNFRTDDEFYAWLQVNPDPELQPQLPARDAAQWGPPAILDAFNAGAAADGQQLRPGDAVRRVTPRPARAGNPFINAAGIPPRGRF